MSNTLSSTAHDVTALLGGAFPGHTMQRLRTPEGLYRYNYVSTEVQAAFGLDAQALMEEESVDHAWIHDEDRVRFVAALERSASQLTTLDEEVRVMLPGGGYKWVRSLGQPRSLPDGSVIWDGVALDVTDRREALQALERALSDAKRNEVSDSRYAAIASQDVIAPLNALAEAIGALVKDEELTSETLPPNVAEVKKRFDDFNAALSATRALVSASPTQVERAKDTRNATKQALTARQLEIMQMVHAGASNKDIADALSISEGTVKLHISAILKRTKARNRTEASHLCFG